MEFEYQNNSLVADGDKMGISGVLVAFVSFPGEGSHHRLLSWWDVLFQICELVLGSSLTDRGGRAPPHAIALHMQERLFNISLAACVVKASRPASHGAAFAEK
jgi:hypothetical protein